MTRHFSRLCILTSKAIIEFSFNWISIQLEVGKMFPSPLSVSCEWSVEFVLIGQNRSSNQRSDIILEDQIQNFSTRTSHVRLAPAHLCQIFIFKNSRGSNMNIFFVKNGMKFPFTVKNKCKNTNRKFELNRWLFWTPKKARFWFLKKKPPKFVWGVFRLWFSSKNNKCTNFLLEGIFENAQKKLLTPFWPFLAVNNFYMSP